MFIYPSVLEYFSHDLDSQIKKLSSYFDWFQIDITDGTYVKNRNISLGEALLILRKTSAQSKKKLFFDFHLMVKDYQKAIREINKAKKEISVRNIIIHYSLIPKLGTLQRKFPHFFFGLAINPEDKAQLLSEQYNLKNIPIIQIMSIHPGEQGSSFLPETLKKIEQLRILGYRNKIFLDGGISDKTLPIILEQRYYPDILAIGSFLTKSKNLTKTIKTLKSLKGNKKNED